MIRTNEDLQLFAQSIRNEETINGLYELHNLTITNETKRKSIESIAIRNQQQEAFFKTK